MSAVKFALRREVRTLYEHHHDWLYHWLYRKLGCSHHAADVAHDTFLRIIASHEALPDMREPRAYLTTTAKRLLVDRARRQLIEQAYLAELAIAVEIQQDYPSPEQIVATFQALEQICTALDGVSTKAREAFLRHYLDGETHAAVADHLGVSTKMVQKYLIQVLMRCQRTPYPLND